MLSYATEEIAMRYVLSPYRHTDLANPSSTGETIGGLLNASFG
jgi:hypothetical protein